MHTHEHAAPARPAAPTGSAAARGQRGLAIVLGLSLLSMLVEVAGGLLTGSLALFADAGHMLTDVLGLAMALFAIRFAQRPATPAKTYGFYRTEILAALTNSLILFAVAGSILYQALQRLWEPQPVSSVPMLIIALGGLVVNLIGIKVLHAGAGESLNLEGAFLEVVSDLLGSVGVVLAAIVIYFTGWWVADPLVSILIGLFILPRTWRLLRAALDVLLEAAPPHIDPAAVERALLEVPGVATVHDLHVWTITSGFVALSAHVTTRGRRPADVLHDLQVMVHDRFGVRHATLQVESPDHAGDGACCEIDPRCLIPGGRPLAEIRGGGRPGPPPDA